MKKILVSWIAWYYDFKGGWVDFGGPTYSLHERFWKEGCEKHLLLSSASPDDETDNRSEILMTTLKNAFPSHPIELIYVDLQDIFDFREIKQKAIRVLRRYKDYEIDILFSNGTTPMRAAWVLIHLENNNLKTHLIQGLDKVMGEGESQFREVELDGSIFNYRIEIKQQSLEEVRTDAFLGPSLAPIYKQAEQIAQLDDITCLIRGESGTGKELLARYIHAQSIRSHKPLVAVNCAALGDELLESRLFGYKKGAFTGAEKDQEGFFDAAQGGTLFLDEIGDISPYMQQVLLRVLQEKEITPLGSNESHSVDVRVIAATNRDLWALCEQEQFRWDLFYRLAMTELLIPPLREYTTEERQQLTHHLLNKLALRYKRKRLQLSSSVDQLLTLHSFPGNIRELENLLTNAYVFSHDEIQLSDLPQHFHRQVGKLSLKLDDVEARHIQKVLQLMDYNLTHTYQALGLGSVNTLKAKMKKYGIERERG